MAKGQAFDLLELQRFAQTRAHNKEFQRISRAQFTIHKTVVTTPLASKEVPKPETRNRKGKKKRNLPQRRPSPRKRKPFGTGTGAVSFSSAKSHKPSLARISARSRLASWEHWEGRQVRPSDRSHEVLLKEKNKTKPKRKKGGQIRI